MAPTEGSVRIDRPVFIVCPPRSGGSLLFSTLGRAGGVVRIGTEGHGLVEGVPSLAPSAHGWDSNRLVAADATAEAVALLHERVGAYVRDREDPSALGGSVRILDKTPKNALRVTFLAAAFPDARFVYLYRDPRETISAMLDAWRSGRFVTYPDLEGWRGSPWSLLLVPGWRELVDLPLASIVARQWSTTVDLLLDDLETLPSDRWCIASYDRLVADPREEIARICEFLDLALDVEHEVDSADPRHSVDSPNPEKWHHNADDLADHRAVFAPMAERARTLFASAPRIDPIPMLTTASTTTPRTAPVPSGTEAADGSTAPRGLEARHDPSVFDILDRVGSSLAITTGRADQLVLLRPGSRGLDMHFRTLRGPTAIARGSSELAVGLRSEIVVFRDQPELGERIGSTDRHDGCFVVRRRFCTGDIGVEDLASGDEGLWVVSSRFSCLATLDGDHSFVPRWQPGFISGLSPDDRCHLNGVAVVDGRPRYVTVLAMTDRPGGWRDHLTDGGAIIEVPTGAPVSTGLAMPNSPRWHDGRLWVLEAAIGALVAIDPDSGSREEVARVPGFARGLAFAGRHAFVGVSKHRGPTGIEADRGGAGGSRCGIWVIDTGSGVTVGRLIVDRGLEEVVDLEVLEGLRHPELLEPGAPFADTAYFLPDPGSVRPLA